MQRLCLLGTAAIALAVALSGCGSSPEPVAGTTPAPPRRGDKAFPGIYLQQAPDRGAGYRLEVHSDGRWAMANLSSGFWGTWTDKDDKVILLITDVSSGKLDKPREMPILFDGADMVNLGEEWGSHPFQRQAETAQFLISFADTSLADR